MFMLTEATLTLNEGEFSSEDQRYILSEMVRYFRHESTGISSFDRMNPDWKELVAKVHAGAELHRSSAEVENSIGSWHQEQKDLCLLMSRRLGKQVSIKLPKAHRDDPGVRFRDDCEQLVKKRELNCILDVPNAAAPIHIQANLGRRNIVCAMRLAAPQDKQRSKARINWLLRQLATTNSNDVFVKGLFPGRAKSTQCALTEARENPHQLETDNKALTISSFEVMMVKDLAAKFASAKGFIQALESIVTEFYEQAAQHLREWVPQPPKLEKTDPASRSNDVMEATPSAIPSDAQVAGETGNLQSSTAPIENGVRFLSEDQSTEDPVGFVSDKLDRG
jgi:hypothetical protein